MSTLPSGAVLATRVYGGVVPWLPASPKSLSLEMMILRPPRRIASPSTLSWL